MNDFAKRIYARYRKAIVAGYSSGIAAALVVATAGPGFDSWEPYVLGVGTAFVSGFATAFAKANAPAEA